MNTTHVTSTEAKTRKVETDYELTDTFDSDWRLGWE